MNRLLIVALTAMFFQQTFATVAKNVVPVIAPAALPDLGVTAEYVGYFISLSALVQVFAMVGCGNFIRRYGGLRISQIGLLLVAIGLTAGAFGYLWLFIVTAFVLTTGSSVATPASSQILARVTPAKQAPIVFSAKQTAVPFGMMTTGLLLPWFVGLFGWQGSLLATAVLCVAFAIILEPTRTALDVDRDPTVSLSPQGIKQVVGMVLHSPDLRMLSMTMFSFVSLQITYSSFLILFLTQSIGYSLPEAGGVLATAMLIGMPARILWGYVASVLSTSRNVIAALGFAMACASVATGFYTPEWHYGWILAVAVVATSTAFGWHGVVLSEIARLAPPGQVGSVTGAMLAISAMGQVTVPLVFSVILAVSASYTYGFIMAAILPAVIGMTFIVRKPLRQEA